jgi:hypothetical protein
MRQTPLSTLMNNRDQATLPVVPMQRIRYAPRSYAEDGKCLWHKAFSGTKAMLHRRLMTNSKAPPAMVDATVRGLTEAIELEDPMGFNGGFELIFSTPVSIIGIWVVHL